MTWKHAFIDADQTVVLRKSVGRQERVVHLKFMPDRGVLKTVDKHGNTSTGFVMQIPPPLKQKLEAKARERWT